MSSRVFSRTPTSNLTRTGKKKGGKGKGVSGTSVERPLGRPSKLTPERQERLFEAIRAGNYYEAACGYANISSHTFSDWMRKGRHDEESGDPESKYADFRRGVLMAEQEAEANLVAQWRAHTPDDWKAAATFLERRHPERWSRRDRTTLEHTGKGGRPLAIEHKFTIVQQVIGSAENRQTIADRWREGLEERPLRRVGTELTDDE